MATPSDLDVLEAEVSARITAAPDHAALEAIRADALGKQGAVSALMKTLGAMSPEQRQIAGPALNGLKDRLNAALAARLAALDATATAARLQAERIDVSLSFGPSHRFGALHPLTRVQEEWVAAFRAQGFALEEGVDLSAGDVAFPAHLYGAVRASVRLVRGVRTKAGMYMDGLVIAPGATLASLHGVLHASLNAFCEGEAVEVRLRPAASLDFTPSLTLEARLAPAQDWAEIASGGMLRETAFAAGGPDPLAHQGFAFRVHLHAAASLKYAVPDDARLFAAEPAWLKHYGFSPFALTGAAG
jgi:phenylalanyl-tRNA synthetase alpha chain